MEPAEQRCGQQGTSVDGGQRSKVRALWAQQHMEKQGGPEVSRILNVETILEYLQYLCGNGLKLSFVRGNNALHKQFVFFKEIMRTK